MEPVTINIKPVTLSILPDPMVQYHFDYSGRLLGHFNHDHHFKVGIDGSVLFRTRHDRGADHLLNPVEAEVFWKNLATAVSQWNQAEINVNTFMEAGEKEPNTIFSSIEKFLVNMQNLENDFQRTWNKIPILPPLFYQSVVINISQGCSYNQCHFCSFYRHRPFRILNPEQLNHHLDAVESFFGHGITARKNVFLGEANAVTIPTDRLLSLLECVQQRKVNWKNRYPEFKPGITGSFLDGFTAGYKSRDEWSAIHQAGLDRLSIGIESGSETVLSQAGKPLDIEKVIDIIESIHETGIRFDFIFLLGLGGSEFKDEHFEQSVNLISRLPVSTDDTLQLSELNADLIPDLHQKLPVTLSKIELEDEYKRWKKAIRSINPTYRVIRYPTQFFIT